MPTAKTAALVAEGQLADIVLLLKFYRYIRAHFCKIVACTLLFSDTFSNMATKLCSSAPRQSVRIEKKAMGETPLMIWCLWLTRDDLTL
jgi:hypothetical protein